MSAPAPATDRKSPWRVRLAPACGFLAAIAYLLWREWQRHQAKVEFGVADSGWFNFIDLNSTPYVVLFALLPVFWLVRTPRLLPPARMRRCWGRWFGGETKPGDETSPADGFRAAVLCAIVFSASLFASWTIGIREAGTRSWTKTFRELPPVYHDEYSYLFQAKLFADGRWSVPSHNTQRRLFDQMHIVNDGRMASRYFPATAAWMAPFVAIGEPYWSHWLAGALAAAFVFLAGRELGGNGVGFLAGLLMAASPGIAIFSNLLLAHHPTLLGLTVFLYFFLRLLRTGNWWWALFAGIGLAFAMLARPMTAAGFGLPFGIVFVYRLRLRGRGDVRAKPQAVFAWMTFVAMAFPILVGFGVIAWQNCAVTGGWLTTPYGYFQTRYTPRHVYGFNNVERAERKIAVGEAGTDDVFKKYDTWAKNLTPGMAASNVNTRLWSSLRWTFAVVPLLLGGVIFVVAEFARIPTAGGSNDLNSCEFSYGGDRRWWLIAAAILSLHLAHVPYWFTGIMDWHYIFETAPLWLLVFARGTQLACGHWIANRRFAMPIWWALLIAVAVTFGWHSPDRQWQHSQSPIDDAATQMAFTKVRYERFHRFVDRITRADKKSLVLIEPDEAEFHFEYVQNEPSFRRRVLLGRYRPGRTNPEEVAKAFPERTIHLVKIRGGAFVRRDE